MTKAAVMHAKRTVIEDVFDGTTLHVSEASPPHTEPPPQVLVLRAARDVSLKSRWSLPCM